MRAGVVESETKVVVQMPPAGGLATSDQAMPAGRALPEVKAVRKSCSERA